MSACNATPQQWCPPELTAASVPLLRTKKILQKLSDDKKGVEKLADRGPDPLVAEAFRHFVERWDLALWTLGNNAGGLGEELRFCAEEYDRHERDLMQRLRLEGHGYATETP